MFLLLWTLQKSEKRKPMEKIRVGTEEWLKARRGLITATDLPIILGFSPWCTPLQLYERKKEGIEIRQTEAMLRGIELEDRARKIFEKESGHFVDAEFRQSQIFPWMGASFDGINDLGVLVEIKCPNEKTHVEAMNGKIPIYYHWQIVHQMVVAGVKEANYVSFRPENPVPYVNLRVELSPDDMDVAISESKKFWERLQEDNPPQRTSKDKENAVIATDEDFLIKEAQLFRMMGAYKELEEHIEELKAKLIEECKGQSCVGSYFKFTPSSCKGAIDYSKIPELKKVDLEQYRKSQYTKWMIKAIDDKS